MPKKNTITPNCATPLFYPNSKEREKVNGCKMLLRAHNDPFAAQYLEINFDSF